MHFGTSYFDNLILKHFKKDLAEIKRQGCDFIVLTFSEANLCFHKDTFRTLVAEAKRQKLTVFMDPWAVGGVFGGETLPQFAAWHLDECQVRSDGKRVPALCINSRALRNYLKHWTDAVASFKVDYLLWDEPHFYLNWMDAWFGIPYKRSAWSCRCHLCQTRYRKEVGGTMPKAETDQVKDFKRRCIRDLLLELSRYSAARRLKNALTLLPSDPDWFLESMAKDKSIHMMGGEAYFEEHDRPKDILSYAAQRTRIMKKWAHRYQKPLLMWVRGHKIDKNHEKDVIPAIQGCVKAGAEYVAIWGFEGCKHVSSIACADSDKVWKLTGNTFRELKKRER